MAIWGKDSTAESRPKSLPLDSNSPYGREFATATTKGWVFQPGLASAATGNDNALADPEILVAIRNLSASLVSTNIMSIDYATGVYADAALFDLVLTFDEAITVTSAAWSSNQTITNKAYILLARLGATDMVVDSTIACMYVAGSGTNTLTFRGTLQSADAGYIGFSDYYFHLDGTATMIDPDGVSIFGIADQTATATNGNNVDAIVLDGTDGTVATINGAITTATASIVVDTVSGSTIAVGQVVTVKGGAASITDASGDTGVSTDGTLTITAVASQTAFTVSETVTVADGIILNLQSNASGKVEMNASSLTLEGANGATDITSTTAFKTGFEISADGGQMELEVGTDETGGQLIQEVGLDTASVGSKITLEDYTRDADGLITVVQAGSTSGSGEILSGVTTT
tara:strand:+ start:864 stop:2072 length:1209 start_codon:yes stop_codon:yes gene_type:complete